MRIRRTVHVLMMALLAIPMLGGTAFAGGRPDPPPDWLGPGWVVGVVVVGAIYASIVGVGFAYRRRHR